MAMLTIPLTKRGAERLKAKLHWLKTVKRKAVIRLIKEARKHGDLSENAEYTEAKREQASIEGQILELGATLAAAQIIDPAMIDADGRIVFGATVVLDDLESGDIVTYQIVGNDEADLEQGLVSVSSPIARALIGKYTGEVAVVQAPSGAREYEIIEVRYI